MEKILITGTGRCGTTFLIKLFSFLEFDTGFTKNDYNKYIFSNCNSGMEKQYNDNYYILKNPIFMSNIENIVNDTTIIIKYVIIPIRDLNQSAISRANNGIAMGGFWNATDELSQINYYKDILTKYICCMTKYDINTIFIDFDKMINDKSYLFDKLKNILDEKNIDFTTFSNIYDEVSCTSKPHH
jgi:hypothetical protein